MLSNTHTHLFLFLNDDGELCVRYAGVEFTAHERSSFIVFNVAHVLGFRNLYVFRESLKHRKKVIKQVSVNLWDL